MVNAAILAEQNYKTNLRVKPSESMMIFTADGTKLSEGGCAALRKVTYSTLRWRV
jgi:hypothetical protein